MRDHIRLPGGKIINDYYRIEAPDYVIVHARGRDGRILMERHYKQCLGRVILTSPAGGIDPGETPLKAAKRELLEETGYAAGQWKYGGAFNIDGTRGICKAHIFLAENLSIMADPRLDDMENHEIVFLSMDEITSAFQNMDIVLMPDLATLAMVTNSLFTSLFVECVE